MSKKDWPSKRVYDRFKDSDLHVQFAESLCKDGYRFKPPRLLTRPVILKKTGIIGHISMEQNEIRALSERSSLSAVLNEKKLVFGDSTLHAMIITPEAIKSPTIRATFLPDGNLSYMYLVFGIHDEIDHKLVFHCNIHTESPAVLLSISEYQSGINTSTTYIKYYGNSFYGDPNPRLETYKVEEYFNGEKKSHRYEKLAISEVDFDKWNEKLLLEYQTSDAQAMSAVFTFLKKLKDYIGKDLKNYHCYNSFSWLVVRCMECFGKYTDEVVDSVSCDLGLSDAQAIKHILRYVQKK